LGAKKPLILLFITLFLLCTEETAVGRAHGITLNIFDDAGDLILMMWRSFDNVDLLRELAFESVLTLFWGHVARTLAIQISGL
jgi:hypothetical protein